jgi:hypothetical protein
MRRFFAILLASTLFFLAAHTAARAASKEEVQEAVRLMTTTKDWIPRAKDHAQSSVLSSDGMGLQFVRGNRLYTVHFSGTWLKGVLESKKQPDGTWNVIGGMRDVPQVEQQLMFLVRPDGVEETGRFFILIDTGLDGTINEAFEDSDSSSSPVRVKVLPAAVFSDGTGPCDLRPELCGPRHIERKARWQRRLDRAYRDLLAFLRNK